jgi:predicted AAA+ superfamily ATPase
VTVIGPRQSGKSTLCKSTFPDKPIVNLEDPEIRLLAESDPKGLLNRYPDGCFIDEIQRCPALLSYIQVIVDKMDLPGQFIVSGSHQLLLMDSVAQSLAGRTAILKLLPFSFEEIEIENKGLDIDSILYRGSYPEIVSKSLEPQQALSFYVQTYLEKDVRQMQAVRDLSLFQNFLKLLAGRSGNLINTSSISSDLGTSEGTIRNWISIAEASFIVFKLQPYYKNLGKRTVKTAKIYFFDTGLLCYLLGIRSSEQLKTHPLRGAIFETYIVSESMKYLWNRVRETNLYFYADKVLEIDMIAETSAGLIPIEIKSAVTFRDELLKRLNRAESRLAELGKEKYLVYGGEDSFSFKGSNVISVNNLNLLGDAIDR